MEIFSLNSDGHYMVEVSAGEGAVSIPGCPGLTLDLDALWRKMDSLLEEEEFPESSAPQD